jgi:hypothetical protein
MLIRSLLRVLVAEVKSHPRYRNIRAIEVSNSEVTFEDGNIYTRDEFQDPEQILTLEDIRQIISR